MKPILPFILALLAAPLFAQINRFSGNYPLAIPKSGSEQKIDFDKTLTAIAGGIILMEVAPTKREDPEALTRDDYASAIEQMIAYASELDAKAAENLKKVSKAVKSGKYEEAVGLLKDCGATTVGQGSEEIFFIWKTYLHDKRINAPWLNPDNLEINKRYRLILNYVSQHFDKPFGAQAEFGAVLADAAQALSNSLENPKQLSWLGEKDLNFKQQDELRRLASNVAYFEWRMHDPKPAVRSAQIPMSIVQHIKLALFDMVRSLLAEKAEWSRDEAHGKNLLQLYTDVKDYGWTVNGDRAVKQGSTGNTGKTVSNSNSSKQQPAPKPEKEPKEKAEKPTKEPKEKAEKPAKEPKEKTEKEPKEKKEKDEDEE